MGVKKTTIIVYSATCDNCQWKWNDGDGSHNCYEKDDLEIYLKADEWIFNNDKLLCPECYCYDEDDNVILNQSLKDKYKKN